MQNLSNQSSANAQNTNQSTLGWSVTSTEQNHTNNHSTKNQLQPLQTQLLQAGSFTRAAATGENVAHLSLTSQTSAGLCTLDAFAVNLRIQQNPPTEESKGQDQSQVTSDSGNSDVQLLPGTALDKKGAVTSPYAIYSQTDTATRIFSHLQDKSNPCEPDRHSKSGFMHFDKASSSSNIQISQTGLTVQATDKSQKAVCNVPMSEGIHYWEVICPIKTGGILFGITTKGKEPISVTQTFHSTTARSVVVELNFDTGEIRYFIQGRHFKKIKNKKLPQTNLEWYALVEFNQGDQSVILNPFCRLPVPESQSQQLQSKIPENIHFDVQHINLTLVEQMVGNRLLLTDIKDKSSDELKEILNNLQTSSEVAVQIQVASKVAAHEKGDLVALLTFDKWQDLIKFTKVASESKLKPSGPRVLAKEVLRLWSQNTLEKIQQPLDLLLIEVLTDLIERCHKIPVIGQKHQGKDIPQLRLNLLDHLHQIQQTDEAEISSKGMALVTQGSQIKLIKNTLKTEVHSFSNYPVKPDDEIHLRLKLKDALFLIQKVSAGDLWLASLYERLASDFDGSFVRLGYVDALGAVQSLLKIAVKQYQLVEKLGTVLAMKDVSKKLAIQGESVPDATSLISFTEAQRILKICLDLEDQLWAMTQSQQVSPQVKMLWPQAQFRPHSALSRLMTMLTLKDSENPIKLAELGVINISDESRHFIHYQDPTTPLEKFYQQNLVNTLEKQLIQNYLTKSLDTWNTNLENTLNFMPPSVHHISLKDDTIKTHSLKIESDIDQVLKSGNFLMTANNTDGSINLHTTQLGMNRVLKHNFLEQSFLPETDKDASLKHLKFKTIFTNENNVILSRRGQPIDKIKHHLFTVADLQQPTIEEPGKLPTSLPEEEKSSDGFFAGLFDLVEEQTKKPNKDKAKHELSDQTDQEGGWSDGIESDEERFVSAYLSPEKGKLIIASPVLPAISVINALVEEEQKIPKEPKPKPTPSPVESEEAKALKLELASMGFLPEYIESAFAKTKTFQLDQVLELILKIQEEESQKPKPKLTQPVEEFTYIAYSCSACTFANNENPGKKCQICGTDAPDTAKVLKQNPQIALLKQQEDAKILKDLQEKQAEDARLKKLHLKELRRLEYLETARKTNINYFKDIKIVQYILASNNHGKSRKPLLVGCALQSTNGWLDIHFKWARYRRDYIHSIFDDTFDSDLQTKQNAVEAYVPASLYSRNQGEILRISDLAVCRVNLKQVDLVCQLGDSITQTQKLKVLVVGTAVSGSRLSQIIKIDSDGMISTETVNIELSANTAVYSDGELLFAQNDQTLSVFNIIETNGVTQFDQFACIKLQSGEVLVGYQRGLAKIRSAQGARSINFKLSSLPKQQQPDQSQSSSLIDSQYDEAKVLEIRIDPHKVTIDDLDKYESMMKGEGAKGVSNSLKNFDQTAIKHTWQAQDDTQSLGPMKITLENPTSLISLNLDIQFKCCDTDELYKCLESTGDGNSASGDGGNIGELKLEDISALMPETNPKTSKRLGLFSVQSFTEELNQKSEQSDNQYLPLMVVSNKGSCYNHSLLPSKILIDDEKMFASNYAKPEITFSHVDSKRILIDKITIRTPLSSQTGAYPLGEGMIFLSDTLQPFEHTEAFSKFTKKDYSEWKQQRLKDSRPLRPNEPVAYFSVEEQKQVTFEVEFKRSAKYIMLKPTEFRQKPSAFVQNVDQVPMEIQFFGVSGTVQSNEDEILETVQVNDTAQNLGYAIASGFDVEVRLLDTNQELTLLQNIHIDQLKVSEHSIGVQTLLANRALLTSNLCIEGQSLIRISDPKLQLQKIDGVQVTIRQTNGKKSWQVLYCQIECIKAKSSEISISTEQNYTLFQNDEIPSVLYRSCLLLPKYFSVVNQQIVSIIYDKSFNERLRIRAIQLLKNIIYQDARMMPLVLEQIDLTQYLKYNIFGSSHTLITQAVELLQLFQSEYSFSQTLYEILIEQIEQLPNTLTSFSGYEALIGMMKWAMPVDVERTLDTVLRTLHSKLLMKINQAQTSDAVLYRTRYLQAEQVDRTVCSYPFDTYSFKSLENKSSNNQKIQDVASKRHDLIRQMWVENQTEKSKKHQFNYKLFFLTETFVDTLKFYFEKLEKLDNPYNFLISIEVSDGEKVILSQNFPIYTYNQYAVLAYDNKADKNAEYALTIGGIKTLVRELTVTVKFGATNSTLEKGLNSCIVPKLIIEAYGKISEQFIEKADTQYDAMVALVKSTKPQVPIQYGKSIKVVFAKSTDFVTLQDSTPKSAHKKAQQQSVTSYFPASGADVKSQSIKTGTTTTINLTIIDTPGFGSTRGMKADVQTINAKKQDFGAEIIALKLLQDELRGKLHSKPSSSDTSSLVELVHQIKKCQLQTSSDNDSIECLQYLVMVANDLAKLINYIVNLGSIGDIRSHFLKVSPSMTDFCLELFDHLVVRESGNGASEMTKFFRECLFNMLTEEERKAFIAKVLDLYLSTPKPGVSQNAVLESIRNLGVSSAVLIHYMQDRIQIGVSDELAPNESPIIIMQSVLLLASVELKKIQPLIEVTKEAENHLNELYRILFYTSVWVCRDRKQHFRKEDQTRILLLLSKCMSELGKRVSTSVLVNLAEDFNSLQTLLVDVICFQDDKLLQTQGLQLRNIMDRVSHWSIVQKSEKDKKPEEQKLVGTLLNEVQTTTQELKKFKQIMNQHQEIILKWLLEFKLRPESQSDNVCKSKLREICLSQSEFWIQQVNTALDNYLTNKSQIKQLNEDLSSFGVPDADSKVESSSSLLSVIQDFISMLSASNSSQDQIQQLWTLALRSLQTVDVQQLVMSGTLENLIDAFLASSKQIKQTTFTQILKISETISNDDKSGQFICKLLFKTLDTMKQQTNQLEGDAVVYSICLGWLDILTIGHISANTKSEKSLILLSETTITSSLLANDVLQMLCQAADYLNRYLNQGSFEGPSGAKIDVVLRLQIVTDMIMVCLRSVNSQGKLSLQDLLTQCQTQEATRESMAKAMDQIITWLFLSGRSEEEEKELLPLSNGSNLTPATALAKQITNQLTEMLELVSDCNANTEAIQLALSSLTKIVKAMNRQVDQKCRQGQLSFFIAVKLTKRSNALFTKLLAHWLVSDTLVNYFVFALKGFDFLLDIISADNNKPQSDTKKITSALQETIANQIAGSDLEGLFCESTSTPKAATSSVQIDTTAIVPQSDYSLDENFQFTIVDLAKNKMILESTSGPEAVSSFQNIDWPVNRKGYKHRVYQKILKDQRGYLEHEMLFKLPQLSVLREIQIGFVNYWASESEVCIEPLTVLLQGGFDKDNLQHICVLEVVTDTAFMSVNSTVFAKNLQEYQHNNQMAVTIEEAVRSKLGSLVNFKCMYLKFSMRRNVMTCLENSPLATRLGKQHQLAINYISISGYDMSQVKGNPSSFIAKEQKKAALEVMSLICSGDFSAALQVIANQKETIEKIKSQFDLLTSLVELKSSMIEPTLVSISTYNAEMGDWIIKRFITTEGFEKHAGLCGKIIVCDKKMVSARLQLLLQRVIETLQKISISKMSQSTHIQRLLPFIEIFVKTLHLVAPEINQTQIVDLQISQDIIVDNIIPLLSSTTKEREQQSQRLRQLLQLIMSPPTPFVNTLVDKTKLAIHLLENNETYNEDECYQRRFVASLLAAQNHQIAVSILNLQKDSLLQLLKWDDPNSIPDQAAINWAKFWINTSSNQKVKARLQDDGYPLKLYELIKEKDDVIGQTKIIKQFKDEYLVLIVEIILRLSAGNKQIEQQLSKIVIEDLETLKKKRDMFFINKVLLPLIKNEETLPICFVDSSNSQEWNFSLDPTSQGGDTKSQKQDYSSFLPSTLIDNEVRPNLIKAFKEIVGRVSTSQASNTVIGQWNNAQTITQIQQIGGFPQLWTSIQGKGPLVILIKGENKAGKKLLFGGYCSKQMPMAPVQFDSDQDVPVHSSPEDFLFCHIQDEGFFFFKPNNNIILEFFSDYESGGALSMGSDFMQISMSYDFKLAVGPTSQLTEFELSSVPKTGSSACLAQIGDSATNFEGSKEFTFERAEIWLGNIGQKQSSISGQVAAGNITKVINSFKHTSPNSEQVIAHPWLNQLSPFNYFRSRNVFMIPSHLTLKKVTEILLYLNPTNDQFLLTNSYVKFQMTETVQEVYDRFMQNQQKSELAHNILDLNFSVESLRQAITFEEDPDINQHVSSQYVPKNGFFDQFEIQGGVKQFIAVTLATLTWWKDKKLAESWSLWLKEIDSFSEIPLFFQIFLKNQSCKELLFKVLSGDPDKDVDTKKWEQEQREAVQVNYKILAEIFAISNDLKIRQSAVQAGFLDRILERLGAISGEKPRQFEESEEEEEIPDEKPNSSPDQLLTLVKNKSVDDKNKVRSKRAGVGYSSKQGETFNVIAYLENKQKRNEQIKILVDIVCNFFTSEEWQAEQELTESILSSPLLPLLESAFRNGSWLDMAKEAPLYHSYMALTRALASQKNLVGCLVEVDTHYKPQQTMPIYKLLGKLNELASIFLQCLNQQQNAVDVKKTKKIKSTEQIEFFVPIISQVEQAYDLLKKDTNGVLKTLNTFYPNTAFINTWNDPFEEEHYNKTFENTPKNPFIQQKIPTQANQTSHGSISNNNFSQPLVNQILQQSQTELQQTASQQAASHTSPFEFNSVQINKLLQQSFQQNEEQKFDPFPSFTFDFKASAEMAEMIGLPNYKQIVEKVDAQSKKLISSFDQNFPPNPFIAQPQNPFLQLEVNKHNPFLLQAETHKPVAGQSLNPFTTAMVQMTTDKPLELSNIKKQILTVPSFFIQKLDNDVAKILEKEKLETDKIQQDLEQLNLNAKISSSYQQVNNISNDEWEDIENDSSNQSEQNLPVQKFKIEFKEEEKPKKYNQVLIKGSKKNEDEGWVTQSENSDESSNSHYSSSNTSKSPTISQNGSQKSPSLEPDETPPYDDEEDYSSEHDHSEDSMGYETNTPKPIKEKSSNDDSYIGASYSEESPSEHSNSSNDDSIPEEYPTSQSQQQQPTSSLNENNSPENPEKLARDVTRTFQVVQEAVENILRDKQRNDQIEDALALPIPLQYRALLSPLRFDYMDMQEAGDYKHHYKSTAASNMSPPPSKMVRLAQELADLSNALPSEHTNSIFVRVDKSRVDMMKALIAGATGTPYAHGVYEFDIFCENSYPNVPPKMNLMTTGAGQIRFNPNLYACGKVCLSLLGTWRGNATENWDAKLSTILQVLLSTQAIIMSEEVYFNEPGFENEAGTPDGERRNEGYMNIVRYGNVKYAMLGQLKKPSKGFETAIMRHFYIKKAEILTDIYQWVERADKVEALFTGLVSDHNHNIAKEFQKTKTKYREMLQTAVKELEDELHKLDKPKNYQILPKQKEATATKQKQKDVGISDGKQDLEGVDMDTDDEKTETIDTTKQIDIDDEAVKDRWSRYIGAMGVEAVAKQAAANIFLSGAGALGIEIAKNLVLSGCKSFTLHDDKNTTNHDLSGQFFLYPEDVGKSRSHSCLPRLQQLNFYVRCKQAPDGRLPSTEEELSSANWNLQQYDVVILTEATNEHIIAVNNLCRKHGKKFIFADVNGVFGRVFNDFGDAFEVLDKNGEELQDCMIKSFTVLNSGSQTLVELLPNAKHKFEDGDEVLFDGIQGMELLEGSLQPDLTFKSTSINQTIWKVTVVSPYSFKIGDTRMYEQLYKSNGLAKQLRTKLTLKFKPFDQCYSSSELPLDPNLAISDFEKMTHNLLSHLGFETLDRFRVINKGQKPAPWNKSDCEAFITTAKEIVEERKYDLEMEKWSSDSAELQFLQKFAYTSQGVFGPLCAFFGGFTAQEVIKAITGKFSPTYQLFYYDAIELLPSIKLSESETFEQLVERIQVGEDGTRLDGLRICLGDEMIQQLAYTKLFMVGAGAIGCELLKNYAMLGVGTGKEVSGDWPKSAGQIVLTDPDIIEVSNLNRQFLFREKHLRKPKSQTAAAAAIYMNPALKGNIIARLDKVFEGTAHIFTDSFFEGLTIVTNALDNIQARKYVDARCVTSKTPLLESGTLGPKGHVQVILPYKTESYGQQEDPEDVNEIPHCTMKMFPEETLHCVEWARDKFGRLFTQMPQSAIKLLEEGEKFQAVSQQDITVLKDGMRLLKKRPANFLDCVEYARMRFEKIFNHDVKQLLHVYPLDSKTKEGNMFWSLPKRPPTPIDYNKNIVLHRTFITSMACLRANIFFIEIPSKAPRSEEFRIEVGENAAFFKPPAFVPNDEKAKEIQDSVNKASKKDAIEEEKKGDDEVESVDEVQKLIEEFMELLKTMQLQKGKTVEEYVVKAEIFEKDNDSNFHIDFMYSMANCRSLNYKLDPMDWINVKLKAGRIVPALATTTASIAGLQTLELVKVVKGLNKDKFRNIFLNLAVPFMQAGEPGDVIKEKLLDGLEVSLWDIWEVQLQEGSLSQLIITIEDRYAGLEVIDIMRGNTPIYFHAIMSAPGKETEKKQTLESSVRKLTESEQEDYIDLNITCIRKDDPEHKILKGVPPVRVWFKHQAK